MSDYLIDGSTLEDIADAIRSKTGGSSLIAPEDMPTEIASISGGGGATSFTFNPSTNVTNNSAPSCVQSILDSVSPVIGDVPFYVSWLDGNKPTNFLSTLLYIPVGWTCAGVSRSTAYVWGSRAGNFGTVFDMSGGSYYVNISTGSLYRCTSLADHFEEASA